MVYHYSPIPRKKEKTKSDKANAAPSGDELTYCIDLLNISEPAHYL